MRGPILSVVRVTIWQDGKSFNLHASKSIGTVPVMTQGHSVGCGTRFCAMPDKTTRAIISTATHVVRQKYGLTSFMEKSLSRLESKRSPFLSRDPLMI